jgi:hypothetical protein
VVVVVVTLIIVIGISTGSNSNRSSCGCWHCGFWKFPSDKKLAVYGTLAYFVISTVAGMKKKKCHGMRQKNVSNRSRYTMMTITVSSFSLHSFKICNYNNFFYTGGSSSGGHGRRY